MMRKAEEKRRGIRRVGGDVYLNVMHGAGVAKMAWRPGFVPMTADDRRWRARWERSGRAVWMCVCVCVWCPVSVCARHARR